MFHVIIQDVFIDLAGAKTLIERLHETFQYVVPFIWTYFLMFIHVDFKL